MGWNARPLPTGLSGIDWGTQSVPTEPDPYFIWADLTQGAYLSSPRGPWHLLLTLRAGQTWNDVGQLPDVKLSTVQGAAKAHRTATTPVHAESLRRLHALAQVEFAEPGLAVPNRRGRIPVAVAPPPSASLPVEEAAPKAKLVIGVIDGPVGWLNRRFRDANRSRLARLWNQNPGENGRGPNGFDYGTEWRREQLDPVVEKANSIRDEARLYERYGFPQPDDEDAVSHGSHVLDLILRTRDNQAGLDMSLDRADVVYVQLPEAALADTGGNWSTYVLDGLHYILGVAGEDAAVIVNLSLGAFAGPHNGSSALERAIDACIAERSADGKPKLHVVVAAGNAYEVIDDQTGKAVPCHARVVLKPGESQEIGWMVPPGSDSEHFVECRVDGLPDAGTVPTGLQVSLRLRNGPRLETGPGGHAALVMSDSNEVVGALICSRPPGRPEWVLAALAGSRNLDGRYVPPGRWRLGLTNTNATDALVVDLWSERRDLPGGMPGESRPQSGFKNGSPTNSPLDTLGSVAGGTGSIVVGAVDERGGTFEPSPYASSGPAAGVHNQPRRTGGRSGPDLSAIGRHEAAGFYSGTTVSMEGTSMAAARVTRAIAQVILETNNGATLPREAILELLNSRRKIGASPDAGRCGAFVCG